MCQKFLIINLINMRHLTIFSREPVDARRSVVGSSDVEIALKQVFFAIFYWPIKFAS